MVVSAANGGGLNLKSFSLQVLNGRWFMAFSSFLIMSVSGASYMFALYSREIKSVLGYDQSTLNLLSFFKDLGSNIGILSGLINEITPPWVILAIGGAVNFFGYFMVWLAVTRKIAKPQVWTMCLYIFIGANSHCSTNTGVVVTSVKNFPGNRGIVLGILSGYLGLSAAIITQLYYAFYGTDIKSLILLMAWLPSAVAFVFLPVIRNHKGLQEANDSKVFYRFLHMTLVLAGFLMVVIILQKCFKFTQSEYYVTTTVMLLLIMLPFAAVIMEEHRIWKAKQEQFNGGHPPRPLKITTEKPKQENSTADEAQEEKTSPHEQVSCYKITGGDTEKPDQENSEGGLKHITYEVQAEKNNPHEQVSCCRSIFSPPNRGEDYTILQAIFSRDMLVLFIATICGIGGNHTVVNNLSQIGISLGYPSDSILTFVSLMAIWIYLGKVVQGVVSEYLVTKHRLPRPILITAILLISSVGHLLIAFNLPNGLYAASIIIGFCFGANLPVLSSIISELFGLKYYSTLYNVGLVASPIGSYLLSVRVAGHLYDREAMRQMAALGLERKPGEELNCNGGECYRLAFFIITGVCMFGALVSLVLVIRTREFYRSDIYRKFRKEVRAAETEMAVANED